MLSFYESSRRQTVPFKPTSRTVKMYVCGPTPYDKLHLGHARTFTFFDTLARILGQYGFAVDFLINFSDISPEVLERARKEGVRPHDLAKRFFQRCLQEIRRMHINMPTRFPMISSYVPTSIQIIKKLLNDGWAYRAGSTIFFDSSRSEAVGSISHVDRDVQGLRRFDLRAGKRDPLDFIIWEECVDEPRWQSPFGAGRPGWHIQDVSVAYNIFGGPYDIHGGAVELAHPHHESEEMLGQATTGAKPYVQNWVHVGLVTLGGHKMSKSRGNVVYLEEAVEKWGADTVRLALLTHPQLHELEADSDLFSNTRVLIDEVCRRLKALKLNGFVPQRDVAEASYKTIHHIRTHLFKGIDAYNLLNLTDKISDKRRAVEYVFPVLKMLGLEDCIRAAGHNEG